jgi:hypothetical protein
MAGRRFADMWPLFSFADADSLLMVVCVGFFAFCFVVQWTLWSVTLHSLAATMIVTLGLDFWRIGVAPWLMTGEGVAKAGVPFVVAP